MAWFIDPTVLAILETVLSVAGPNFNLPYDSSTQPPNGSNMLADDLLKFKLPGGAEIQGMADPSSTTSMGKAISGLLTVIAPFVSAYSLILPILGVIRGIIEVICALMNPFAVIAAIIRLFRKWIPAFISLFPPFAGVLIIIGIIKMILAVAYSILTTIIPIFQLIKHDMQVLASLVSNGNEQQKAAEKTKLDALILELLNQTGILNVIKPIMDIVLAILRLAGGFPCGSGGGSGPSVNCPDNNLTGVKTAVNCGADATCCTENVCPPILLNPPQGLALVVPTVFSDAIVGTVWNVITLTGNENLYKIAPYVQSLKDQLNSQLDQPIDEAQSAGSSNSATMSIQITGRRGQKTVNDPIIQINDKSITVIDPAISTMIGVVQYKIVPNFDVLVAKNVIGLGCHPDIAAARDSLQNQFVDPTTPAIQQMPELANIGFDTFVSNINGQLSSIVISPPYDTTIIDNVQTNVINLTNSFVDNLKNILNSVLSKIVNPINSTLDVDKNLVRAGDDQAIISVTPRDSTGALIAKQLPIGVGIDVKILTDFGTISNQVLNSSTGIVTATISSLFSGTANITAKINDGYITEFVNTNTDIRKVQVTFISDAVLPKRRLTQDKNTEKEPGGK